MILQRLGVRQQRLLELEKLAPGDSYNPAPHVINTHPGTGGLQELYESGGVVLLHKSGLFHPGDHVMGEIVSFILAYSASADAITRLEHGFRISGYQWMPFR